MQTLTADAAGKMSMKLSRGVSGAGKRRLGVWVGQGGRECRKVRMCTQTGMEGTLHLNLGEAPGKGAIDGLAGGGHSKSKGVSRSEAWSQCSMAALGRGGGGQTERQASESQNRQLAGDWLRTRRQAQKRRRAAGDCSRRALLVKCAHRKGDDDAEKGRSHAFA